MPALVAGAHEGGGAADWNADNTVIDQCAGGLVAAAQEGIGSGADAQAFRLRHLRQFFPLGEINPERLFRIGVLSRVERLQTDRHMRFRNSQVDDDLHRRIAKQFVYRSRRQTELGGLGLGKLPAEIGQAADVKNGKVSGHRLQIGA